MNQLDPRLVSAREALRQVMATTQPENLRRWCEAVRDSDATVLAFDVDGNREDLAGIAIHDGTSLFLSVRYGSQWRQLSGDSAGDVLQTVRHRWTLHPEVETFGETDGFVTYYDTNPDDDQFHDSLAVSASTCSNSIFMPDEEQVLLSLGGRTRLVNIIIQPDNAKQLAKSIKKAAKKAGR